MERWYVAVGIAVLVVAVGTWYAYPHVRDYNQWYRYGITAQIEEISVAQMVARLNAVGCGKPEGIRECEYSANPAENSISVADHFHGFGGASASYTVKRNTVTVHVSHKGLLTRAAAKREIQSIIDQFGSVVAIKPGTVEILTKDKTVDPKSIIY